MKKMSVVLGLLLAVLVMGCGIYESYGFDYKQLSSIERGMSFKEVCTILGEPAFRDLNKEGEAWTFRAYTPAGWSAVKVWFKDGKVDEMKSYLEDTYPVTTSRDKSFMNEEKRSSDKSSENKGNSFAGRETLHQNGLGSSHSRRQAYNSTLIIPT